MPGIRPGRESMIGQWGRIGVCRIRRTDCSLWGETETAAEEVEIGRLLPGQSRMSYVLRFNLGREIVVGYITRGRLEGNPYNPYIQESCGLENAWTHLISFPPMGMGRPMTHTC